MLRDATKTEEYLQVRGVRERLFFCHHRVDEDGVKQRMQESGGMLDMSKSNTYEIECVLAMVKCVPPSVAS